MAKFLFLFPQNISTLAIDEEILMHLKENVYKKLHLL